MDLNVRTETFGGDNQSWLDSAHGQNSGMSVTIVQGTPGGFTPATHYPNGDLPSGIPLGKITASGKYGRYDSAASDGRQNFVGHLLTVQKVGTGDIIAPLFTHGRVNEAALPFPVDAAAKTAAAGRIQYI